MKVYICADMEGLAGVVSREQISPSAPLYGETRALYLHEVNAAVDGAFDGGADSVIVMDNHCQGLNLPVEDLDARAEYVLGAPSVPKNPGLDEKTDALILIGYHAMAGTRSAVRDHTMSSMKWHRFAINGREMGEIGLDAAVAGYYGVPVVLVTGDDKACAEAEELLGGSVSTLIVKKGFPGPGVVSLAPRKAQELVRSAVKDALQRRGGLRPLSVAQPAQISVEFKSTELAETLRLKDPNLRRADGRTVVYEGDLLDGLSCILTSLS